MSESAAHDYAEVIASLREQGGVQIDAVRFHYLETLAQRAQAQPAPVRQILEGKLATALLEYRARFDQAQGEARAEVERTAAQFSASAEALWQLFNAGNFDSLRCEVARLQRQPQATPLSALLCQLEQPASPALDGATTPSRGDRAELKSVSYFRDTWSSLSADQTLAQALATGPSNAGPLNSHSLVLQSLKLMRDTAPDYLKRFMAYADALLWLEQANVAVKPAKKTLSGKRKISSARS
ncbi:MAG TPA: DUF2894 domain-containing protein [Rhodocyclaceae bacterium]